MNFGLIESFMHRKIKVCLLWHNLNSENYGVSALAVGHIILLQGLSKKMGVEFEYYSVGTKNTSGLRIDAELSDICNISIVHYDFSPKDLIKSFLPNNINKERYINYDLLFDIGEGDSFSDIYGMKRYIYISIAKLLPLMFGRKLILAPQTYGPYASRLANFLSSYIVNRSLLVFSRDHKSTQQLRELGRNALEVADVAFALPFDKRKVESDSVGLNVSGLLWNGGYTNRNQFGLTVDYKSLILDVVNGFVARGKHVHLVAHVISHNIEVEDDYRVCVKVKTEYFPENTNVIVAPRFGSPIEAKSYISSMEFFSGSRMHATIAAVSSGVATVPLAYSRKFSGLFESLSYAYTLDIFSLSADEITSRLFAWYDNELPTLKLKAIEASKKAKRSNERYIDTIAENVQL